MSLQKLSCGFGVTQFSEHSLTLLLRQKKKQLNRSSLLILPASLLANWRSEIERFAPSLNALFYHGAFDGLHTPTKRW